MKTGMLFATFGAIALAGFILMAVLAAVHDTFPADVWLSHRIQDVDIATFDRGLDWAEDAADFPAVVVVCAAIAALLLLRGDGVGALIVVATTAGRPLSTWAAKELIERPRPAADLVEFDDQPSSFSFPSGHAEAAFLLYGLIFYFAALHIRDVWLRTGVQGACVFVIMGAGLERVYAGHHWPSDVIGGYYLGALILSGIIAVHRLFSARRQTVTPLPSRSFSPATPTAEHGAGSRKT